MAQTLVPGQNIPLSGNVFRLSASSRAAADFSAFRLGAAGRVERDEDFVFYGQKATPEGDISLSASGGEADFGIDLSKVPARIGKIAFAVTGDAPDLSALGSIDIDLAANAPVASCRVDIGRRSEAALILCELYRRGGAWKFRFVDQGFNGGLKALAEFYGVDVADDPEPQSPPPPPEPEKVSLSKVTLTKSKPKVDLGKKSGIWKVNLNWLVQAGSPGKGLFGSLFGGGKQGGVDLDLAAFVRGRDGRKMIIQALGGQFGSLRAFPWLKLMGDDRTGEEADGEWIHINGDMISEIAEIIIFTFIYEGAPNWAAADAVARIWVPGSPEIETRLAGTDNSLRMCAIARIANDGGNVSVERLDRYFTGHPDMDSHFGWGFEWVRGRK